MKEARHLQENNPHMQLQERGSKTLQETTKCTWWAPWNQIPAKYRQILHCWRSFTQGESVHCFIEQTVPQEESRGLKKFVRIILPNRIWADELAGEMKRNKWQFSIKPPLVGRHESSKGQGTTKPIGISSGIPPSNHPDPLFMQWPTSPTTASRSVTSPLIIPDLLLPPRWSQVYCLSPFYLTILEPHYSHQKVLLHVVDYCLVPIDSFTQFTNFKNTWGI